MYLVSINIGSSSAWLTQGLCPRGGAQTYRWPTTSLQLKDERDILERGAQLTSLILPSSAIVSSRHVLLPHTACHLSIFKVLTIIFATLINSICRRRKLYSKILNWYEIQSTQSTVFSMNFHNCDLCWNLHLPLLHSIAH